MTIRELMSEIKSLTKEINTRRKEYQEEQDLVNLPLNYDYERRFEALESRGYSRIVKKNDELRPNLRGRIYDSKLGRKRFKRKADLEQQLADLKSFISLDVYTPKGKEKFDEIGNKQYEAFKSHFKPGDDFTEEDWTNFIEQFKMIKNESSAYGYEDQGASAAYVNAYLKANERQRATFGKTIATAYKNLKKKNIKAPTYKGILREAKKLMKTQK